MAKLKASVIGNGMLGSDLHSLMKAQGWSVSSYSKPDFDITNLPDLEHAVNAADIIVNCAAYTHVDGAETEKDIAYAVNAHSVGELARLVKAKNKYLLHISTDFVYDGNKDGIYTEKDRENPINTYGKSKLEGERNLFDSGCRHCTIRVQWTYGRNGNNFVKKICERAKSTPQFKVVDDQFGSPTATVEVAKAILEMAKNEVEGLYLYAASGYTSRFDIANHIIRKLGLNSKTIPCKSDEFPAPAKRPLNSRFDCSSIDRVCTHKRSDWISPLNKYLEELL